MHTGTRILSALSKLSHHRMSLTIQALRLPSNFRELNLGRVVRGLHSGASDVLSVRHIVLCMNDCCAVKIANASGP